VVYPAAGFISVIKMIIIRIGGLRSWFSLAPAHKFRTAFKSQLIVLPKHFRDLISISFTENFLCPVSEMVPAEITFHEWFRVPGHIQEKLHIILQGLNITHVQNP